MEFERLPDGQTLVIRLFGELDSETALMLEEKILLEAEDTGTKLIIFDAEQLECMSHDLIRILLMTQKIMISDGRGCVIQGVNGNVLDTLKVTGMIRLLNVEHKA